MSSEKRYDEYIEIKFGPHWRYISAARGFVQSFLAISTGDDNLAERAAMSASELLENAVKYSSNNETMMNVEVNKESRAIRICVKNQATTEQAETLSELLNTINEKEPFEAYLEQMKKAALREDGQSQLGLVRIRYEGGAEVGLTISEDNLVCITIEM